MTMLRLLVIIVVKTAAHQLSSDVCILYYICRPKLMQRLMTVLHEIHQIMVKIMSDMKSAISLLGIPTPSSSAVINTRPLHDVGIFPPPGFAAFFPFQQNPNK